MQYVHPGQHNLEAGTDNPLSTDEPSIPVLKGEFCDREERPGKFV